MTKSRFFYEKNGPKKEILSDRSGKNACSPRALRDPALKSRRGSAGRRTVYRRSILPPSARRLGRRSLPPRPEAGDLDLTAGWAHAGNGGVTMQGKGRVAECGNDAFDVFLNEVACWRNIPAAVWHYTIGGYQVIKKWLSYREKELLGRGLTPEEIRYFTEMARRIAALIALHPSLDENYRQIKEATHPWPAMAGRAVSD